jgi:hypothetical protein
MTIISLIGEDESRIILATYDVDYTGYYRVHVCTARNRPVDFERNNIKSHVPEGLKDHHHRNVSSRSI